jgi:hypothetical protein
MKRTLAVELTLEQSLGDEPVRFEDVPRTVVIVEDANAELGEVHLVEGKPDQRMDRIAAEAAIPGRRLADEEAEPRAARYPVDVVNRRVADVAPVVLPLDGKVALASAGVDRVLDPLLFVLEGDRITRLEGADDVRVVHPAVGTLGVIALERAQDDVLSRDHEPAAAHLSRVGREVALGPIPHAARDYTISVAAIGPGG